MRATTAKPGIPVLRLARTKPHPSRLSSSNSSLEIEDVFAGATGGQPAPHARVGNMERIAPNLLSWASLLEDKARLQAERTSRLSVLAGPVALMADAHWGLGSTVGSVIPTKGAILPSAIGVDIGCFREDTLVPLVNGAELAIGDMAKVGGKYWVYSVNTDGETVNAAATASKTRTNAALVRVTLTGGHTVVCTPDHLFMLSDGSYRAATELCPADGLMPFSSVLSYSRSAIRPLAIERLAERTDVYCLNVFEYHNFVLSAGVVVHNCGMIATDTGLDASDLPDDLGPLLSMIEEHIPAGVGKGRDTNEYHDYSIPLGTLTDAPAFKRIDQKLRATALNQMGTLGAGNHYGEVLLDENDRVWIVFHSGSRGVGNKRASYHIGIAKELMKEYLVHLEDPDLAYFVEGTPEFDAYIADMLWAQAYALANREAMMNEALKALGKVLPSGRRIQAQRINTHHNYARREVHGGQEMWVTRKGAISAQAGELGIIPGSMGTSRTSCGSRQRSELPVVLARGGTSDVARPGS